MSTVDTRWAAATDAHDVALVHVASWRVAYRGLLPDDMLDQLSVDSRAESWRRWLSRSLSGEPTDGEAGPSHRLIVAHEGHEVLGWVGFGGGRDAADAHRGELAGLYVHSDHWKRGVGSTLLARAEKELRLDGWKQSYLWVLAGNDRAITFYQRHGWLPDGGEKTVRISTGFEVRELRHSSPVTTSP